MNEMERRVKNLEAKADEKRGKRVAYCWIEPDEDEEKALAKWKEENGGEDPDLEIFITSWAGRETWPTQERRAEGIRKIAEPLSVDEQIEKIVGELQGDGYTLEDIAAMVQEQEPVISEPEKAPQPQEAKPASDLVKLFGRRR